MKFFKHQNEFFDNLKILFQGFKKLQVNSHLLSYISTGDKKRNNTLMGNFGSVRLVFPTYI